jgi:hypothetical protein
MADERGEHLPHGIAAQNDDEQPGEADGGERRDRVFGGRRPTIGDEAAPKSAEASELASTATPTLHAASVHALVLSLALVLVLALVLALALALALAGIVTRVLTGHSAPA